MKFSKLAGCAAALLVFTTASGTLQAQPREELRLREWHRDIHRYHDRDFHIWRGGHWYHGRFAGRYGWWWMVDDRYYYYPQPVYPYPDPLLAPGDIAQLPPPAPIASGPPVGSAPPPQPSNNTWYYCDASQTYYPYVTECRTPWRPVPATPGQR